MRRLREPTYLIEKADNYGWILPGSPAGRAAPIGKTTLTKAAFPDKAYVTLEPLDTREFARTDPRGFLSQYRSGAIIAEVQHAPDLLSYLQEEVDRDPTPGRFILTGSQNLAISAGVSQSLAGRSGILHLLPFSREELAGFSNAPKDLFELLWTGCYPRIYDRSIPAQQWLADYVATYVQRDVRQMLNVGDLGRFTTFLRLCAAHTAQELKLSALGADAGISHNTANAWLSVLESSFLNRAGSKWISSNPRPIEQCWWKQSPAKPSAATTFTPCTR